MSSKVKLNLLYLLSIAIALAPLLTVLDRTFASEFVGRSLGFGLGLLAYPPTALPLLLFTWFTRRWNLFAAAFLGSALYLVFILVGTRGFIVPGESFTWAMAIFGLFLGTSIGIAVLQLIFILIGRLLSSNSRSNP